MQRGSLTHAQLEDALAIQAATSPHRPLGQLLTERGLVMPEEVARALAEVLRVPYLRLKPDMVAPEVLSLLPRDFLESHNALPLYNAGDTLIFVLEEFANVQLHDQIARRLGRELLVVAADPANIRETRAAAFASPEAAVSVERSAAQQPLEEILAQIGVDDLQVVEASREDSADVEADASGSPTVKLLNYVIKCAIERSASDIHIEPDEGAFRIRYRVDGELVVAVCPPSRLLAALVSRIKILSGMDISERRMPQDGSMTVTMRDQAVDIRVSTMTGRFGEKVVMRVLNRDTRAQSLDGSGMDAATLASFRGLIAEPNGLILVTGPTGSGKSTTLYGALAEMVTDRRNLSTLEDPIERIIPGINQFQVAPKADLTFARALRAMLRQDPDVIMVGEIRDPETAKLATEAALTGHLVLSTLHTNDAATAIPRLVNMGVEPYLVAATLRGVIAQRLIRRICTHCAASEPLTEQQQLALRRYFGDRCPIQVSHVGRGCGGCENTGSRGRIGVFELLLIDENSTCDPTRLAETPESRNRDSRRLGLLADGIRKVEAGIISLDSLLATVLRCEEPHVTGDAPRLAAA